MLFSYPSQPKYRAHSFVFFFWKNQRMTFRSFWKLISSFQRINDFSMNLFLNLLLHDINCKDWDWQDYLSYAAFLVEMIYPFLLASRGWLIFIEKCCWYNSAISRGILQNSERFGRFLDILQNSERFCNIFRDFARFGDIL